MEPDIQVVCCACQIPFFRRAAEVRRNAKRGREVYCGNSCQAKASPALRANWGNPDIIERNLKPNWRPDNVGHPLDEFSPFRPFLNKTKLSNRRKDLREHSLTLEDLKSLWERQRGICPYTGFEMILPATYNTRLALGKDPRIASLDRIDSSRGYTIDNIEFVCMAVNLAKNTMSKQIMLDFFAQIRHTQPPVL